MRRDMADYLEGVGARLLDLRRAHQLSQEDAAHRVGVAVKTWRNWEGGLRAPYESNWRKVKEGFDLTDEQVTALRGSAPTPLGLGVESTPVGDSQLDRVERRLDLLIELVMQLLGAEADRALSEAEARLHERGQDPPDAAQAA
jgi:transcriptional regulator with XRE-family HTH domain